MYTGTLTYISHTYIYINRLHHKYTTIYYVIEPSTNVKQTGQELHEMDIGHSTCSEHPSVGLEPFLEGGEYLLHGVVTSCVSLGSTGVEVTGEEAWFR